MGSRRSVCGFQLPDGTLVVLVVTQAQHHQAPALYSLPLICPQTADNPQFCSPVLPLSLCKLVLHHPYSTLACHIGGCLHWEQHVSFNGSEANCGH